MRFWWSSSKGPSTDIASLHVMFFVFICLRILFIYFEFVVFVFGSHFFDCLERARDTGELARLAWVVLARYLGAITSRKC